MGKNMLKKILISALVGGMLAGFGHKAEAFDAGNTVAAWIGNEQSTSEPENPALDEQVENLQASGSEPITDTNKTFELLDNIAGDYNPEQKKKLEQLVREKEKNISGRNFCITDKNVENVEYVEGNKLTPMASIFATSEKYLEFVKDVAAQHNMPYQAMVGIMVIENGGGTNKVSPSGCVGLFQFAGETEKAMKRYANKQLGEEKYNISVDQRTDPYISAEIAGWYLDYNYKLFGRWDFAIQAYHDGEGYLGSRLKQHVKNRYGYSATKKDSFGSLVKKYDLKLVDLLTDEKIKFTSGAKGYYSGVIFMYNLFTNKLNTMDYMAKNCGRRPVKYVRK